MLTTFKAKGLVPDTHPLGAGVLGRSGTPVASWLMNESTLTTLTDALGEVKATDQRPDVAERCAIWRAEKARRAADVSGNLGSIGFGYPAAMGAWAAAPDRPIVAVTGDGGFGQYATELTTAVKYGIPIKHVLLCNPIQALGAGYDRAALRRPEGDVHQLHAEALTRAEQHRGADRGEYPEGYRKPLSVSLLTGVSVPQ